MTAMIAWRAGIIADGRLLDLLRRVYCFGTCLMKLDLRQESARHTQFLDHLTRCPLASSRLGSHCTADADAFSSHSNCMVAD